MFLALVELNESKKDHYKKPCTVYLAFSRHSDRDGTARRDVSIKNSNGWGPSFPPLFFSRSLASRRTPLSERLEQANSVSVELVRRSVVQFGKVIVLLRGFPGLLSVTAKGG